MILAFRHCGPCTRRTEKFTKYQGDIYAISTLEPEIGNPRVGFISVSAGD